MGDVGEDALLPRLLAVRSNLTSLLRAATITERSLADVDKSISRCLTTANAAAEAVLPLQSQVISAKALHSRINRAISPALGVLNNFSLVESLQRRLLRLSNRRDNSLPQLLEYVDTVDRLHAAIAAVTDGCDPAVQRLQEAVGFLSRTKAVEEVRIHQLLETLDTLKVLYEDEVEAMSYEGLLDKSLVQLQEDFESLLQQIRYAGDYAADATEIRLLGRIANTLASNDCVDICIDIYVKVRYRRAARAVMNLKPELMKTYVSEIERMEWPVLEAAIGHWIEHFELAVTEVFAAEKRLCEGVLGGVMDGSVWPECFANIYGKIVTVFFRFGEEVALSFKVPQKLFKLLEMFDGMDRMRDSFIHLFDGEPGDEVRARFKELQKLIVQAASKVFFHLEVEIEGDIAPPPPDASVPKMVRYAVNYLKCLVTGGYAEAMGQVLQTEKVWKAGFLYQPEPDESLLRDAVSGVLDAVQRNVEGKRGWYNDKAAAHLFAMNAQWYMYTRARGTALGVLLGENEMRRRYKTPAEEAAYAYQATAWGSLVRMLERGVEEGEGSVARMKMEAFLTRLDETVGKHRGGYCVVDLELRKQMRKAAVAMVMPAYTGFLNDYWRVMQGRSFPLPETIEWSLGKLFDGVDEVGEGKRSAEVKVVSGEGGGGRSEEDRSDCGERGGRRSAEVRPGVEAGAGRRAEENSNLIVEGARGGERWRRVVKGMVPKARRQGR